MKRLLILTSLTVLTTATGCLQDCCYPGNAGGGFSCCPQPSGCQPGLASPSLAPGGMIVAPGPTYIPGPG